MKANELEFIFALFSFVSVIGIIFYILLAKTKIETFEETIDILEHKFTSLQDYVYELEARLEAIKKTPSQDDLKKRIIEMYEDGKDVLLIENTLDVPRAKIEMVLKFHKLQVER